MNVILVVAQIELSASLDSIKTEAATELTTIVPVAFTLPQPPVKGMV